MSMASFGEVSRHMDVLDNPTTEIDELRQRVAELESELARRDAVGADIVGGNFKRSTRHMSHYLESAFGMISEGVVALDEDFEVVAWNDQIFNLLGIVPSSIESEAEPGKLIRETLSAQGDLIDGLTTDLAAQRDTLLKSGRAIIGERRTVNGEWLECLGAPVKDGGYVLVYRDISKSKQMNKRLEYLALTDPLTGVANRRSLLVRIEAEFYRSRRYKRELSVLVFDIDHFKTINDSYGQNSGDNCIKEVAELCKEMLRDSDVIGRADGKEFVILLPETNKLGALTVAERLRAMIERLVVVDDLAKISLTASIGVATLNSALQSPDELIKAANDALQEAKQGGRNRVAHR